MAAFSLRVVEETWEPNLVDCITFERHNGRRLPYRLTYILCQVNNAWIAKHAAVLATGTRFAHCSIWNDPRGDSGQYWQMQELFFHQNHVTQESCRTEMTQYTKKHLEYLQEKRVVAEMWDIYNHHLCQTNKWRHINDHDKLIENVIFVIFYNAIASFWGQWQIVAMMHK